MQFDENGIPILTLRKKLKALERCLMEGCHEDAAGHLCDLLEFVRLKLNVDCSVKMLWKYGESPNPIIDDSDKKMG